MKVITLSCLFIILKGLLSPLSSQQIHPSDTDGAITALMQSHNVPALGLGLIKEGKISYIKVFGELAKNEPAPYHTIFNVASLTKPVVAMLTLMLVNEGQWKLDEPLIKYWIDPDVAADPNARKITTRHVLSHQTGFLNWRWLHSTQKLAFDFEPGTKFQYSGEGFEYLRKALESKFQTSLDRLCDSLVFKPLGMYNSRLVWESHLEARFAKWHDKEGKNTYKTFKPISPNAADDMMTTVEDYTRFGVAVVNGFGLTDSTFKEMVKPHVPINKNSSMTLGWEYFDNLLNGEYAILHTGSDKGVKTLILLFPGSKQGIVLLTNSDNGHLLYDKIIPLMLEHVGSAFLRKAMQ